MDIKNINMPDIWGQGSIFASSGLSTYTSAGKSIVGSFLADKIGFEFKTPVRVWLYLQPRRISDIHFDIVTSDLIVGKTVSSDGQVSDLVITFVTENTIVINTCSDMKVCVASDEVMDIDNKDNIKMITYGDQHFCLIERNYGNLTTASFSYGQNCIHDARKALEVNIQENVEEKKIFYQQLPRPRFHDIDEEKLYYKCFSVMRSMIYSPEGRYKTLWTTPDRYPHKDCWLWDTAFHVIGLKYIHKSVAEDALRAVFATQHEDGYIAHQSSTDSESKVTQPPVLAWAVYELYKSTGDIALAGELFDKLTSYLNWDKQNRDSNHNNLLEYAINIDSTTNRCDESGMDNSPRFDGETSLDCIDFSCFYANEARCMTKLAELLHKENEQMLWQREYEQVKNAINNLLWDENQKFYFDRRMDGTLTACKSVSSFLTLFAGICDSEKAAYLIEHLLDPNEFGTAFPIPTVSADDKTYSTMDMFRGTVWLNFNYLIAVGLDEYGYHKLADQLRHATIDEVKKWYLSDGVIYEFYDSRDKVAPRRLSRKGEALQPYLPDIRIQCVRDFSWGSCMIPDMLLNRK